MMHQKTCYVLCVYKQEIGAAITQIIHLNDLLLIRDIYVSNSCCNIVCLGSYVVFVYKLGVCIHLQVFLMFYRSILVLIGYWIMKVHRLVFLSRMWLILN